MKIRLVAATALILSLVGSCSYKYTPATSSMINVTDYTIGDINKLKTGEACITRVLGFSLSEASTSVIDAMRNGGISKIKMIDKSFSDNVFTTKECTIVHGL